MILKKLTCFLFNDLEPFERAAIEPIMENISQEVSVETIWVTEAQKRFFRKKIEGDYWIIARDWRRALEFLSVKAFKSGRVFVSIFSNPYDGKQLYGLSFESFFARLPKLVTLIVYSPIEYHFLRTIKKVPESQLRLGSLALPQQQSSKTNKRISNKFEIGTFCDFSFESNINFLLGVAHFVSRQSSQIHFNILGRGPLYNHYSKIIRSLNLSDFVSIVETTSEKLVGSLELFLYAPLRNYHFIPVMLAGSCSIPVVSVEIPGIENFILPGKTGLVIPSYEIRTMGEKILALFKDADLRKSLGLELNRHLNKNFSSELLGQRYRDIFFAETPFLKNDLKKVA